jgi:uncharacterized protein (TIGR02646 family)
LIRIHRGREIGALRFVRAAELVRVRPFALLRALNSDDFGKEYNIVKGSLHRAQHFKCCYCEKNNIEPKHNDVEHFRPKTRADHGGGKLVTGYWWLAWTWCNLLFACPQCNRDHKKDRFPLMTGSVPLSPEESPPGRERALLIDPTEENPLRHIQFRPLTRNGRLTWYPIPRLASKRGYETIEALGLHRPELLDLYEVHVEIYIAPIIARLNSAITSNATAKVREVWQNEALTWLDARTPFTALSHDVFDHEIPRLVRRRFGLRLCAPA